MAIVVVAGLVGAYPYFSVDVIEKKGICLYFPPERLGKVQVFFDRLYLLGLGVEDIYPQGIVCTAHQPDVAMDVFC